MLKMLVAVGLSLALAAGAGAADKRKAAAKPAAGTESDEHVAAELKTFCLKWMGFLEVRERDNKRAVKWQTKPEGVAGQFVGYSKDYECTLKERSSNGTPVATIVYREYVYEQKGASQSEASLSAPSQIDATEVTEIFRFNKGEWVY